MPSAVDRDDVFVAKPKVFAAMPFSGDYDDVYFVAMTHAAKSIGAVCIRIGKEKFASDIVYRIRKEIEESIAVIADLSDAKPNVLYEVGYAHAKNRPTVHICSTSLNKLPFEVKTWNTIPYRKGQTHALKKLLAATLKTVLKC